MLRPLKILYEYFALYSSLTLLGLICLTWSVFALPLYFILPRTPRHGGRPARHHVGLSHLRLVAVDHPHLPPGFARHRLAAGRAAGDLGARIIPA